jgi:hypothetical protein
MPHPVFPKRRAMKTKPVKTKDVLMRQATPARSLILGLRAWIRVQDNLSPHYFHQKKHQQQ